MLLALAIPVALVGLYFRKAPEPAPPDTSAILAPIEQSLTALADEKLAGTRLTLDEGSLIHVEPRKGESVRQCADRILATVKELHGSALESSPEDGDEASGWMITLPASALGRFRESLGIAETTSAPPIQESEGDGATFLRVEISRPTP